MLGKQITFRGRNIFFCSHLFKNFVGNCSVRLLIFLHLSFYTIQSGDILFSHLNIAALIAVTVKRNIQIKWFIAINGRRDRDRMVVGFTTTYAISAYHDCCCEFESRIGQGVQHYKKLWKTPITYKKNCERPPSPIKQNCNLKTTTHKIQFQILQFLNRVFGL